MRQISDEDDIYIRELIGNAASQIEKIHPSLDYLLKNTKAKPREETENIVFCLHNLIVNLHSISRFHQSKSDAEEKGT